MRLFEHVLALAIYIHIYIYTKTYIYTHTYTSIEDYCTHFWGRGTWPKPYQDFWIWKPKVIFVLVLGPLGRGLGLQIVGFAGGFMMPCTGLGVLSGAGLGPTWRLLCSSFLGSIL